MRLFKPKTQYVCDHCGHIKVEKPTWKKRLKVFGLALVFIYMGVFTLTGTASMVQLFRIGELENMFTEGFDHDDTESLWSHANFYALVADTYSRFVTTEDQAYFRNYVMENTAECDALEDPTECRIKTLYDFLVQNFEYEIGTKLDARSLIEDREGDCDEMAFLYITLLHSIDVDAKMQCNLTHCWSIVKYKGTETKADLTKFVWRQK